jgi:hypothetical protein
VHRQLGRVLFVMVVIPIALLGNRSTSGNMENESREVKVCERYAPRGETVVIEEQEGGLKVVSNGLSAEGKPTHFEYRVRYDGTDYPVTGRQP